MNDLNKEYWNQRWLSGQTGWDIGYASPALLDYMKDFTDKNLKILIPGCGNAYEAEALVEMGFTNISLIDISPAAVEMLHQKFKKYPRVNCICNDFFEHQGAYDFILEQTFFCALHPDRRLDYIDHCASLLNDGGQVAGLLFASPFKVEGPPFGGDRDEYRNLFEKRFRLLKMESCNNSIPPRAGNELFFIAEKKN